MNFLFLGLIFITKALWAADASVQKHYVIGCTIYNENFKSIKNFGGERCIFMNDGSLIVAYPNSMLLIKYSAIGDAVWRKNIHTHHQMNLSRDHKRLLVLSAEAVDEYVCNARHVVFLILDIKTGKVLAKKRAYDLNTELFQMSEGAGYLRKASADDRDRRTLLTDCVASHFNSFYEISPNKSAEKIKAFQAGNFIITNYNSYNVLIFDKNLKKIIWSEKISPGPTSTFHDAQVLPDGKIIYYAGSDRSHFYKNESSVVLTYDPVEQKIIKVLPRESPKSRIQPETRIGYSISQGSIQKITEGYLMGHNDTENGGQIIFFDEYGRLTRQYKNPDIKDNKPQNFQDVKQYDLSLFLKYNRI